MKRLSLFNEVVERLDDIEEQLQKIFWFIEFHLGEVPIKHRKLFPEKGEYPYFKPKKSFTQVNKIDTMGISGAFQELDMPIGTRDMKGALERMRINEEKAKLEGKWNRRQERLKPDSSEASSATSAAPDSPQENTSVESSPSSTESHAP